MSDTGSGVIERLGRLEAGSIISERQLAQMFGRCAETVKRAIGRGELPKPVRLLGENCWTVGTILAHIERRLHEAEEERD